MEKLGSVAGNRGPLTLERWSNHCYCQKELILFTLVACVSFIGDSSPSHSQNVHVDLLHRSAISFARRDNSNKQQQGPHQQS